METPKQKEIKYAYNEMIVMLERSIEEINHLKLEYKDVGHGSKYLFECEKLIEKAKSLQGIDHNNGWVRIEEDGSNLPYDEEKNLYEVCFFENGNFLRIYDVFNWQSITSVFEETSEIYKGKITHYKPIIKPEPPIY